MGPGALRGAALWVLPGLRGQGRAEHWAWGEGGVGGWARPRKFASGSILRVCLICHQGSLAGRQRPFPGRCLGRRRKTLAETWWGGSAAHTAGGVPRLAVRPTVRGQEMTRPMVVLLRWLRHWPAGRAPGAILAMSCHLQQRLLLIPVS